MMDYDCHYRQEKWQTGRYFEFVEDFFKAARNTTPSPPCDPPSCPTTTTPAVTEGVYWFYVVFILGLLLVCVNRATNFLVIAAQETMLILIWLLAPVVTAGVKGFSVSFRNSSMIFSLPLGKLCFAFWNRPPGGFNIAVDRVRATWQLRFATSHAGSCSAFCSDTRQSCPTLNGPVYSLTWTPYATICSMMCHPAVRILAKTSRWSNRDEKCRYT